MQLYRTYYVILKVKNLYDGVTRLKWGNDTMNIKPTEVKLFKSSFLLQKQPTPITFQAFTIDGEKLLLNNQKEVVVRRNVNQNVVNVMITSAESRFNSCDNCCIYVHIMHMRVLISIFSLLLHQCRTHVFVFRKCE